MYLIVKRFFDIFSSLSVLLCLCPFLIIIAIIIYFDSKGGIFYVQERVGKENRPFKLYKFRSMRPHDESGSKITIGNDSRITKFGSIIRKLKIDELPQLFNIVIGDMSVVGPRPEVREYVNLYSEEQLKVLSVKPGLTDFASIQYFNEQELLGKSPNPQDFYVNEIMPKKLALNINYIQTMGFRTDIKIIGQTLGKILRR